MAHKCAGRFAAIMAAAIIIYAAPARATPTPLSKALLPIP